MQEERSKVTQANRAGPLSAHSCFACGPDNSRGLRLEFQESKSGEMTTEWTPEIEMEGYEGIIHGGLVSTVLDEAMAKAVDASGAKALTAELRVRFRQQVLSASVVRVKGWIAARNKRMINTEATLTNSEGDELAHAWAVFLALKPDKTRNREKEL